MKSTDGVYVSQGASEKLLSDIRRLTPAVRAKVREGRRHRDSCDANAEAWAAALRAAGYSADTVCDGVAELDSPIWHEDSGEMRDRIGHDWCVVDDAGKKIIVDGAIRQFKGQIPAYNGSVWEAVIHPQRFWFKGDAHERWRSHPLPNQEGSVRRECRIATKGSKRAARGITGQQHRWCERIYPECDEGPQCSTASRLPLFPG